MYIIGVTAGAGRRELLNRALAARFTKANFLEG
jgi:hypothetical protein